MKNKKLIIFGVPALFALVLYLFGQQLFDIYASIKGVNFEHSGLAGVGYSFGMAGTLIIAVGTISGLVEAFWTKKARYFFVGLVLYLIYLLIAVTVEFYISKI